MPSSWQIGCALAPDVASFIVSRLLAGIGGAGCLTIGGGVIADIFQPDRRGASTAIYSMGPLFSLISLQIFFVFMHLCVLKD
jgi:MFS family permease